MYAKALSNTVMGIKIIALKQTVANGLCIYKNICNFVRCYL